VVPTWIALGAAHLIIERVPFRRLSRTLGEDAGPVRLAPIVNARQQRRGEEIRRTIAIAARNARFRSDCLRQALVSSWLCRLYRVPYALHLGALIDSETAAAAWGLKAHAWVISGPVAICGGGGTSRFAPLACFVYSPTENIMPKHRVAPDGHRLRGGAEHRDDLTSASDPE